MTPEGDEPDLTPAETRLRGLLSVLAVDTAPPDPAIAHRVVRTARWQRPLRTALSATGEIAGALADGLGLLLRSGRKGGGR